MTYKTPSLLGIFMAAIILSLCSCGSNEDSAGIDASGSPIASQGTIDGFGSVIVNGIRFDSSKALILVNGQTATEEELQAGFQVTVTGTLVENGSGVAEKIEFYPELVGEITEINAQKNEMLVSAILVKVNSRTLYGNAGGLSELNVGDKLQISGHQDEDQILTATRIDLDTELTTNFIQLSGEISNLDPSLQQFRLSNTQINYSGASLINIFGYQLNNKMRVTVKGVKATNGQVQAQQIYNLNFDVGSDIEHIDLEGRVTRFISPTNFEVNGVRCTTNSQTQYEFESSKNLKEGVSVEVSGKKDVNGVLVISRVQFDLEDKNDVEGLVTSISINSGFVATGTIQIGNDTIKTTSSTRYEDRSDSFNRQFNLSSIAVGDYLFVTGCTKDGVYVASKIERKSPTTGSIDAPPNRKK